MLLGDSDTRINAIKKHQSEKVTTLKNKKEL
jgi:hypothetical protein